jgi:Secretion system C-terminal sorting domain
MKNYLKTFALLTILFVLVYQGNGFNFPNLGTSVTIHFTGMGPHLNQNLYLRVVDKGTMKETGRIVQQITTADFDVVINAVTIGRSYFIDFFSDHNSNGLYDPPPSDHAWRLELNNATGGDELNFAHNTNFTDIKWVYVLTVNFSGMTPHVGQMLELRVEDNSINKEVERIKVPSIPSANFDVQIVGLQLNTEYNIDFYADVNGNGLYNVPPTDHAWRITFTNSTGDVSQPFSHNPSFTDINWKYLLTVNLFLMTPHLGELFELRVVWQDNQIEIGRVSIPVVLVPDFTVYIPQFELNQGYNIDFYADHNGNGIYDAPPVDHAWRLSFNSSTGDIMQDFSHNTNFTDIQWPNPSAVNEIEFAGLKDYELQQNYPNPFNPSTQISFNLPVREFVTLKVFNVLGSEIAILINDNMESGLHEVTFNASGLNSGVYFYVISTKNFTSTRKMILLK